MGPWKAGSPARTAFASVATLLGIIACLGCAPGDEHSSSGATAPRAIRMLEPPGDSVSTASLPRAEVASETRPVIRAPETRVIRWREDVVLRRAVSVEVRPSELGVPDAEASAGKSEEVILIAWVSAPDPKQRGRKARGLRAARGLRHRFEAPPVVVDTAGTAPTTIEIEIPGAFRGLEGWLNVLAHPVQRDSVVRHVFGPIDVRRGDLLAFGYGVAEAGWLPGLPPVAFRVRIERDEGAGVDSDPHPIFERQLDPASDPRDRGFFDASIGLDALAGERVRFVLEHQALPTPGKEELAASYPLFANPMVVSGGPQRDPRRNLILISLDTLRAKSVGAYGYARDTTPALDARVVAAGALVEQAIAPVPFTPPSHMTMLTGLEPCTHGVNTRHDVLSPDRITLAEMLRAEGYRTGAFTENAYLVAGSGFARGFDVYAERRDEETAAPGFAAETFAAAEDWLRRSDSRPFFLFVHTYQVHNPYNPPRAFRDLFAGDGLAPAVPKLLRRAQDDYDREIRYTDEIVSGFLDTLDELGLTDSTLLVVTSDHGEAFGEHLATRHGTSLYEEAMHVPMVLRAPGMIPPGTRVTIPVAMADLTPTLLDLLEVESSLPSMGRSFASLLTGLGSGFDERPIALAAPGGIRAPALEGVRTSRYKYMRTLPPAPGEPPPEREFEALYDLVADPAESWNLVDKEPDLLAEAREALAASYARCTDFQARNPAAEAGERSQQQDPGWMVHRDDIDRKLRSLGYIE